MKEELFRKKSLDKIKSPENLNDYIRVLNPGVWLILICVIVLLAGAFVWSVFGHVDSVVPTTVCIENGDAVCYVNEEDIADVEVDMTVEFAENTAKIEQIGEKDGNVYVCRLNGEFSLPDGFYDGEIVTQSSKPISFIID